MRCGKAVVRWAGPGRGWWARVGGTWGVGLVGTAQGVRNLAPNAKESSRESSRETRFFRRAELCAGGGSGERGESGWPRASEITEARDGRGSPSGEMGMLGSRRRERKQADVT